LTPFDFNDGGDYYNREPSNYRWWQLYFYTERSNATVSVIRLTLIVILIAIENELSLKLQFFHAGIVDFCVITEYGEFLVPYLFFFLMREN